MGGHAASKELVSAMDGSITLLKVRTTDAAASGEDFRAEENMFVLDVLFGEYRGGFPLNNIGLDSNLFLWVICIP